MTARRLTIRHRTTYRYAKPVILLPHKLIVTPRADGGTAVLSSKIRCTPSADLSPTIDVFGNIVTTATFSDASDHLVIESEALLDHTAPEWPLFPIAASAQSFPFTYSLDDLVDLGALAQPDWLTSGSAVVGAWARGFIMGPGTDTLSLLNNLNAGVQQAINYRERDEEGTQIPSETLSLQSGSCRDLAGLFIEAVRHLGLGARAVSGYLFDPAQVHEEANSTHAWAEVYLPGAGWVTFDPTHGRLGAGRLVPVAFGRMNRQIMPVSGDYLGDEGDFRELDVSVRLETSTDWANSGLVD